jgi:hypothetical protein
VEAVDVRATWVIFLVGGWRNRERVGEFVGVDLVALGFHRAADVGQCPPMARLTRNGLLGITPAVHVQ